MTRDPVPTLLVPGLNCSPLLYAGQMATLWARGPVIIADHRRDDTLPDVARRILAGAPPRFALAGLSMGGYVAFEMLRQAPERVTRLALLDTSARPETAQQTEQRLARIALACNGRFDEVPALSLRTSVHPARHHDAALRTMVARMAAETGPDAFVRQQRAIMGRADPRPLLPSIRCPTLVLVGDADTVTPPEEAAEIAAGIPGAELAVIDTCGHLSTIERPDEVNVALAAWLDR